MLAFGRAVLAAERERSMGYATTLATDIHAKHFPEVTQWKPLPDTLGLLTQIDNMTCGLVMPAMDAQAELERLRASLLDLARRCERLKRPCGMDPESAQAVRNGEYMSISLAARAALGAERPS